MKCYLEGKQLVVPGKQVAKPPDTVHILLALVRLKQVESDVLITLSIPHKGETAELYAQKIERYTNAFRSALLTFKILSLEVFSQVMVV